MPTPDRFEIIASLPSQKRNLHVAVDRDSRPPCAVVLAMYPRALSNEPTRLERLSSEMEHAARLFHPNVLAPTGIEAVGEDLAAVTVWRDAITVREILDAGGALPAEIAARIAADVCAGLSHAHGRPRPVVHGLVRPEAVLLDESGAAAVSGFGMPGGSGMADDVVGVAELLHECLAGEAPEDPTVPLGEAEGPPALVAVVNRARLGGPQGRFPTADALGAAIAHAVPLAAGQTVAAYVNAILPSKSGARAERRRKIDAALAAANAAAAVPEISDEISDDDIVAVDTALPQAAEIPEPELAPAPEPPPDAADPNPDAAGPAPDAAGPEPELGAQAPEQPLPPVDDAPAPAGPEPIPPAPEPDASLSPVDDVPPPAEPEPVQRSPTPAAQRPRTAPAPQRAAPVEPSAAVHAAAPEPAPVRAERSERRGWRVSIATAIAMTLAGVAAGFALAVFTPWHRGVEALLRSAAEAAPKAPPPATARAPEPAPAPAPAAAAEPEFAGEVAPPAPAPARRGSAAAPERKSRVRNAAAAPEGAAAGMGTLDVTAPDDTEVWLDGRRIGSGNTRKKIPEGNHRVEVRRGTARVGENFHISTNETWTYTVTPQ